MRFCLLCFFILFFQVCVGYCLEIELKIEGIDGEEKDNVLLFLTLRHLQEKEDLSLAEIKNAYQKAPDQIRSALIPFGYYHPEIKSAFSETAEVFRAEFAVEKGEPVIIKEVKILLAGEGKDNQILNQIAEKLRGYEGQPLLQHEYEKTKKAFLRAAYSNGYIKSQYTKSIIRIDRRKNLAWIDMAVDTGPLHYFGKFSSNQEVLSPAALAKFNDLTPGEPYLAYRLAEMQRTLYKSGYFKYVQIRGQVDQVEDLRVPVFMDSQPLEHRNRYNFGLGYDTNTGLHTRVDWENRLFNKSGHKMKSSLKLAERETAVALFYTVPVFDPAYDTNVFGVNYNRTSWDDTETELLSAGGSLIHDGPMFRYGLALEGRNEMMKVGGENDDIFLLMPTVSWGVLLADDLSRPRIGLRFSSNLRGAAETILSDVDFLQGDAGVKGIISFFDKWRLIGRINLGATWIDDIEELPPSLRLYTGGDQTVRGYRYKSIAPREDGVLVGGSYLYVESLELEREMGEYWSLAAFYDAGDAADSISDLQKQIGIGGGLRVRLPFGQIRLDLACAVSEEDNPFRLHLTVGGDL